MLLIQAVSRGSTRFQERAKASTPPRGLEIIRVSPDCFPFLISPARFDQTLPGSAPVDAVCPTMSAEETQQPSFTVTAGGFPPLQAVEKAVDESERSTRHPSPSSYSSVANRYETDPDLRQERGEVEDEESNQTESLRQWTLSQRKANGHSAGNGDEVAKGGIEKASGDPPKNESKSSGDECHSEVAQAKLAGDGESTTPELEVPDLPADNLTNDFEDDNVSTPTESSPLTREAVIDASVASNGPTTPKRRPTTNDASPATAAHQSGLLPMNNYSPFKKQKSAQPSASKKQSALAFKSHATNVEQDSFADDNIRPKIPPAARLAWMMQNYASDTLDNPAQNIRDDDVPEWNGDGMRPQATFSETAQSHSAATVDEAQDRNGRTAFPVSSDQSDASQSVPQIEHDTPGRPSESPTTKYLRFSSNPSDVSPVKAKTFGQMLQSQSSLGLPGEAPFNEDEDDESQHTVQSLPPVATQSIPRNHVLGSSPPPERTDGRSTATQPIETPPRHSHATGETITSSIHPRSTYSANAATQEPTQLVTEDERVARVTPLHSVTPPIATRRVLPSARKWRDGNGIVSLPSDRPTDVIEAARNASTIAAPQAAQAQAQQTMGRPVVLEETYVDADEAMEEPSVADAADDRQNDSTDQAPLSSRPSSRPPADAAASPIALEPQDDMPLEPTYVDPTITSLPAEPRTRRTPKQYGKQAAVTRPSPVGPTPQTLATPPPTAGPSIEAIQPECSPRLDQPIPTSPAHKVPEAIATKSGRVSKRKRRDSSASMSGSDSSSEELDPYDESYRPVSRTNSKGRGKPTAVNLTLKKFKRGSRSGSSTRTGSAPASRAGEISTPLTPPPTSSPLDRPGFVLAYWHPNWHLGRVVGMENDRYEVHFEDGTQATVASDKIRRGVLRAGDKIREVANGSKDLEVCEDWQGEAKVVKVHGGRVIPLRNIYVRKAVVNSDFDDRIVTPAYFGFESDANAGLPGPARAQSAVARSSAQTSETFAGKVFFITSFNSDYTKVRSHQRTVGENIISNGGKVVANWEDLFDLPASGFGSTLTSTSAPFLLQETDLAALTPKVLVSLAKGIPCLSVTYIEDAISDPTVSRCSTADGVALNELNRWIGVRISSNRDTRKSSSSTARKWWTGHGGKLGGTRP